MRRIVSDNNGQRRTDVQLVLSRTPGLSDKDVIARILNGDCVGFEVLMRRYNQRLFRIIRAVVRNDAEAEDVLQETYLAVFRNLEQFEGRAKFSTWLTRIAINNASARRRRKRPTPWSDISSDDNFTINNIGIDDDSAEDQVSKRELRVVIAEALDHLPADLRVIFTLREVEGLSTEEAAECLQISKSNAKVRLHRARRALGILIDDQIGTEAREMFQFGGDHCDRVVKKVLEQLANEHRNSADDEDLPRHPRFDEN